MNSFFQRHRVTILWVVLGSFVIGSVLLFAFNRIFYSRRVTRGPEAETVLVVDGVEIDRGTLDKAYTDLVDTYTQFYRSLGMDFTEQLAGTDGLFRRETLRAQAAEGLIYQVIVDKEARRLGISVPRSELDKAVEEEYRNYLKSLGVDEARFIEYLRARGLTLAAFKEDLRPRVRFRLLEEKLKAYIVGPIEPTDEDLKAYYEENKARYREEPAKVKLAYILIKGDEALANEVLVKAQAPDADFSSLVAEYSQAEDAAQTGGVVDWFAKGEEADLPWTVQEKAFELAEGEVALVRDGNDYYIVKLLGKKPPTYKPFEEVKEEVRNAYIQEKEREKWDAWRKEKRAQVTLEVKEPVLLAFIEQGQGDVEAAIQTLLAAKGGLLDPAIDYYLGRLYESLYLKLGTEKANLEKLESRTEEEEKKLAELREKQEEYKKKAIEHYIAFAENGEGDEALYRRIISLDPDNAYAHLRLAALYFARELYIEAEREYDQVLRVQTDSVEALVGQGDVAMAIGLYDRAVERYRKALEVEPDATYVRVKLAEAYLKGEKLSEARATLEEVLKTSPNNDRALKLMGDLLMAEGKPKEALSYYERAVERNPAWDYRLALGDAYKALGETDKAAEIYEAVKARYAYRYEPYERLGDLYRDLGDDEEAVFWYEEGLKRTTDTGIKEVLAKKIVDLRPDDLEARFRLASYYYQNYKYSAAIEQYKFILERSPRDIDALLGLGDCYVGKTEYDEALKYYKQALALAASDELKIAVLGKIIESEKKRVGPGGELTAAAKEALWQRALIYKRLGRTDKAKADLQTIYAADPSFRADELIPLLKELGVEVEEQTSSQTPGTAIEGTVQTQSQPTGEGPEG
ncbi:MAG: tetratricopeptide repeat protein [Caldiserica bacterium]|nr:tetratricopeptide repeat protein [Caldisericota bacterium]